MHFIDEASEIVKLELAAQPQLEGAEAVIQTQIHLTLTLMLIVLLLVPPMVTFIKPHWTETQKRTFF